jgi:crotonobetainyl-CoA:carnitine CoA-transferase CaiB-like acyl-CoA transferase
MSEPAFSNIKVLDLTEGIAGPYCTRLLADFGAEVVKIEKPKEGDITRKWGPFLNDENNLEKSGTFFYLNTNKKSITLDLEKETGLEIFEKLIESSDILVESWAPGKLAKSGFSAQTLTNIQPDLIVTSISAFGQAGPYRDFASNNLTEFALGGAMYTMRPDVNPRQRPVIEGGFQAEYSTGVLSYIATVAALMGKGDTGNRKSVDIGAMECVASTLMGHVSEYSYMGLSRRTCPFAIHGYPIGYSVPCRDGWISLTPGIGGAPNIPLLIGRPELQTDPLFTEPRTRMANPEKFNALIGPWLMKHDKWNIAAEAQQLRLAFTPVLSCGELLEDEQLAAREFFNQTQHPAMGKVIYPGPPAKLSETPARTGRAPLLGEHNHEIYSRFGYAPEKLAELQAAGVI